MKISHLATRHCHSFHGLGIDILWLCVIMAGGLFITSLIPLVPNDLWWHLKIGEWIFTHRTIPTTNMYAWSIPAETPYFYATWLGELLLYLMFRLGGLELITFARTLLLGITFLLVGMEAKRRSKSWRIAALVVALGFVMTLSNTLVRTQIWSWFPFIFYLIFLGRFSEHQLSKYWLLLLPVVMVFWVNAHGAFIIGLVLVLIYLLGELLQALLKMPSALTIKGILWLGLITLLTSLSTLINPRSFGIVNYVMDLMTDKPSQQLIIEWQSPTPQGIANITFYLSILILMILLAYTKYKPDPTAILTIIGFTWLAWSGQRYIIWYSISIMPILAQVIANLPIKIHIFEANTGFKNTLIAFILFIPVLLVQPWFVESFPLPETYKKQVLWQSPIGPLLSVENPIAAVGYLKTYPGGQLFNEMGYGSYLIWSLPEQGVFIDPRVELYPYKQWQDYIRVTHGADYNRILAEYGADRILLSIELQSDLAKALANDPSWKIEYEDQYAQIWYKISNDN